MSDKKGLFFSRHARLRLQQRSVRSELCDLFLRFADMELPVGHGCYSMQLSNAMMRTILEAGISPSLADRARRLIAIVAADGTVVTVMKRSPA
ncbi:hypothetical protein DBT53_002720, partial [Aerococcus mictus]|uniref:hypothetical protein n=1 Tax=Aerococcus mictus TaxID=2976810 RepID=UPI002FD4EDB4